MRVDRRRGRPLAVAHRQFSLGSPSLVLPMTVCNLPGPSRYGRTAIEQRAWKRLRIQKVVDQNGVRIGGILTRITHSANGCCIVEGFVAGESRKTLLSESGWPVRKKRGDRTDGNRISRIPW